MDEYPVRFDGETLWLHGLSGWERDEYRPGDFGVSFPGLDPQRRYQLCLEALDQCQNEWASA